MLRLPRPPVKLTLALASVLFATAVLGVGLLRAATYKPTAAAGAPWPSGTSAPAPGTPGKCGTVPVKAARELRGMWLTTVNNIDFPSRRGLSQAQVKAEYQRWLDLAVAQRHNAIFVHVRPSGDAFWPSAYAPWSEWLTGKRDGKSPGWDPMDYMIKEAHARNLEFHAWFNPYRGTQPGPVGPGADFAKLAPNHPLLKHRDWAIAHPAGQSTARLYFDPGIPAARKFVEDSMLEAVQKYDVDGVHFDDFFYPYPAGGEFPDDASYAKYGGGKPRAQWRRDNVDTLVREMDERIKALKPWVKFGISPFGIWRNYATDPDGSQSKGLEAYDAIFADTRKWVQQGWLDYIVPQLYWTIGFDKADYAKLLPWWTKLTKGTNVQLYIGMADYRVGEEGDWSDPAMLDRQMVLNDQFGVQGQVHFSAKQIRADRLGAVTRYRDKHYASPALLPRMARLPVEAPPAPRLTGAARFDKGIRLQATTDKATSWALYRVAGDSAALVATGRAGTEVVDPAPPAGPLTYCLSGLDRSGNEGPISTPLTAS
ncbi:glycoside hydrolase family 10 protein [Paractinoplanes lichenicola]|uniref:Family 10 glycosylhydrolase n=1 Tax=Paractinoplanes lichenicola TaxID=2802976 RepID=A0ABS1VXM8_9ACTN|nr:family 10 glycosylhydrolase [Actinoplanes lichenicola]MBL7259230.1 family 10 glycosylhydrolase [Actinoplanes lichenicola]